MTQGNTVLSLLDLNPRKYGSLEEYMVRVSDALRLRGCRSILAFPENVPDSLREKFQASGAVLELMPSEGAPLYRGLFRLLRKYRPDIVHFHFYNQFSLLPFLAASARPNAILFTDHSRLPTPRRSTRAKCFLWDRIVLRQLGVETLAVSAHIKRILENNYAMSPERVRVLLNGVNVSRFGAATWETRSAFFKEFDIPQDSKLIVAAGYFIPEKGFGDLLQAAVTVRKARNDVVFMIVGDGPLDGWLKEESRKLGLADVVRFPGLRTDVDRFMAASDAVVVPSTWQEPAGLVVLEAMASARPVVATRVGGIPEYLGDTKCGVLVQPGSPAEIADAILMILRDSSIARAMGAAARVRAEGLFSMEKWVSETMEVYGMPLADAFEPEIQLRTGIHGH
ncbi:MAG TPA: glycosyltransferase family 4 protein [Terriglobales bacterium]|nr:glycosyltransferase family 4 protein [Terriglobales bacterium]